MRRTAIQHWPRVFGNLMAHLHGQGWRIPFILIGSTLWPIGVAPRRRAANDNEIRRHG